MLIHNTAGDGYGGVVGLLQALVMLGYVQALVMLVVLGLVMLGLVQTLVMLKLVQTLVMLGEVVSNFSCCRCLVAWWQPRKGLAKGKLG